jgi:hypothetical protein
LINRDNLAEEIKKLRTTNKFSEIKMVEVQKDVFIDISENSKLYAEFLEQYLQNE